MGSGMNRWSSVDGGANTNSGSGIDFGVVAEENADDIRLVGPGCQMERRLAAHRRRVSVGSLLQQEDDDVHAAHETGHMQRS